MNGSRSRLLLRIPKTDDTTKKGISTLMINSVPIKNGLKMVVNRYTLSREKLPNDATLPVPKNATLMKNKNMRTERTSLALSVRRSVIRFPL